jgi:hypothetical protein
VEAYVSIDRITEFLCAKELQKGAIKMEIPREDLVAGDEVVKVSGADFAWSSEAAEPTLADINLSLKVCLPFS